MRLIDADAYAAEMREKQDNCRIWKDSLDEGTELSRTRIKDMVLKQ